MADWLDGYFENQRVLNKTLNFGGATYNVKYYGAVGDEVNEDFQAFQSAFDAMPDEGGVMDIPTGNYLINTSVNDHGKSYTLNISPAATFSGTGTGLGAGKFPNMSTNVGQTAVGTYIKSRSSQVSPSPNGGIAAFNVEMLQPTDYVGQSVAAFFGASGSNSDPSANVWTLNPLIRAETGSGGTYQCMEVDVDCFSASATVKGISLNGAGTSNPDVAMEIIRTGVTLWDRGVDIDDSVLGLLIRSNGLSRGVVIGDVLSFSNTLISGKQLANAADSIILQRNTDTSPTGYYLRAVDAANSATIWSVDVSGNSFSAGSSIKSDQSAGLTGLIMENSSSASNTTKYNLMQFKGRDTGGTLKTAAEVKIDPGNSNYTIATYTIRTRVGDTLADRWQIDASGNALLVTLGCGLRVKEGSNAKQGTATLVGGTVVVSNTSVTANSRILLTSQADGGTPGWVRVSGRTAATSFTITSSSALDTSVIAYQIFEPA